MAIDEDKAARLARALRENLRRRKAQARGLGDDPTSETAPDTPLPPPRPGP